jgi:hypothetical protein
VNPFSSSFRIVREPTFAAACDPTDAITGKPAPAPGRARAILGALPRRLVSFFVDAYSAGFAN